MSPSALSHLERHPEVNSDATASVVQLSKDQTPETLSIDPAEAERTLLRAPEGNVNASLLDAILRASGGTGTGPGTGAEVGVILRMSRDIDGPHLAHGFKNSGELLHCARTVGRSTQ